MSWFSIEAHRSFCNYDNCSSFFFLSIFEATKCFLQCMPNTNPQLPTSFIDYLCPFQGRKLEYQNLDNMHPSKRRFLKMHWGFYAKKQMAPILKTLT